MKISYNWLKDYLNIDLPAEELSRILTLIGLEVSKVEHYQSIPGGLEGLVIGKVLTCEKHPNADKLSVTTVDIGGKVLPIVCGAPNVAEGQKVVVAPVGVTIYPIEGEPFKMKKAKIRGEVSEGMIVAEDEIGLGHDHEGIIVLPDDVPVGMPAKEYFDIYEDTVFEIDLTPNRADAFSHFGVARDLYAYLKMHTDLDLKLTLPSVDKFAVDNHDRTIDVEIENPEACPRYAGLTITGIEIKPSPQWMQNRLKAIGLNPRNNIVDITNFVLHEIGHPLHGFDADKITGGKIRVKTVEAGKKFITLDEKEIELTDKDLMICDANGEPLVLAGVLGGLNSGISDQTKDVFLESAFFNPTWVRKSAKRYGISTDSSYRFERGVDINTTIWAIKRAALLIKELAGGKISSEIVDRYPNKIEPFEVELKYDYVDKLLGIKIPRDEIKRYLEVLEIEIVKEHDDRLELRVPTYRWDVRRPADVVEEILRIYGFNNIPLPSTIKSVHQHTGEDPQKNIEVMSDYLTSLGFNEIINTSLQTEEYYKDLKQYPAERLVRLLNPLSSDVAVMRQTLLFGGLETIIRNIRHKNPDLKLYEFGNVYFFDKEKDKVEKRYTYTPHLSIWLTGLREKPNWNTPAKESDFYLLKAYTDNILKRLNINVDKLEQNETDNELLNYGLEYKLNGKTLAVFGSVKNSILRKFEIEQEVFFAEIDWQLLSKEKVRDVKFKPFAKYPAVRRDLALLIDENVKFKQIKDIAYETEKKLLKEVSIFDVYKGQNIPEGKKSYAVSFILQDENKTLTDKQVDKIMNKLIKAYEQKLGAQLR